MLIHRIAEGSDSARDNSCEYPCSTQGFHIMSTGGCGIVDTHQSGQIRSSGRRTPRLDDLDQLGYLVVDLAALGDELLDLLN